MSEAKIDHVEEWDGSKWVALEVAEEMCAMLERAKEVMLNTYDACDYPADGKTDCDICAKDIDALLAKARGES